MIAIPLLVLWIGYHFYAAWYELLVDPPTVELLDRCEWCGEMIGWKHQYICVEGAESTRMWTGQVVDR